MRCTASKQNMHYHARHTQYQTWSDLPGPRRSHRGCVAPSLPGTEPQPPTLHQPQIRNTENSRASPRSSPKLRKGAQKVVPVPLQGRAAPRSPRDALSIMEGSQYRGVKQAAAQGQSSALCLPQTSGSRYGVKNGTLLASLSPTRQRHPHRHRSASR